MILWSEIALNYQENIKEFPHDFHNFFLMTGNYYLSIVHLSTTINLKCAQISLPYNYKIKVRLRKLVSCQIYYLSFIIII